MNRASISLNRSGRQKRTGRLIHKGHELIGKTGHGTSDTDAADIGTAANPAHPAALADVALHHRPPASQFHNAKRRSVFFGKLRLLVKAAAVTTLVHGVAEKPGGPQSLIEGNHGCAV